MKRNKVLVTGGAGFIGSNLVETLVDLGNEVTVLDNLSNGKLENLDFLKDKINFIEGDIRDSKLISELMVGKDCVFHLAAMIYVSESVEKPKLCNEINVVATKYILDECVKNNVKFIFTSSAAVYGEDNSPVKFESITPNPISPYAKSKLDVELLCEEYKNQFNLNYVCFRNFNVYGPKQDINSPYAAVIASFINKALSSDPLAIFGDGDQTRDFIYVGDVVDAMIIAYELEKSGVFNLGCNEIINLKELASLILGKINSDSSIEYHSERKGDLKHSRASSKKFQDMSSWIPKTTLSLGIDKTIKYYSNI